MSTPSTRRRRRPVKPGLVQTVRRGSLLMIGEATIEVEEVHGHWARLRVVAPEEVSIRRLDAPTQLAPTAA